MKVLNRLTIKHLLMNKKRTIVTIIGIILSTALMVGIGLLLSTFLEAMRIDAISYSGSHHAYFDNLTLEQKENLDLNINFSETYSYGVVGYSKITSTNFYKPYMYIVSADSKYFESEQLLEGRLPFNSSEIVLPVHMNTNGEVGFRVGDEITIDVGARLLDGEEIYNNNISLVTYSNYKEQSDTKVTETFLPKYKKTYKIVGMISRSHEESYSAPGYMAFTTGEENIQYYRTYAIYKNVKKTYDKTDEICETLKGDTTCQVNDSLLYYYGVSRYNNVNNAVVSVLSIALSLLSVGCIIVIYNSFAISTMERKKSFGLYSSLGATPRQIKYTVFFEAFIVGLIGIGLGILSAFFGIYVTIQILDALIGDAWGVTLRFVVDPLYIFIPVGFMILVVYFSAFIPARRSSKVTSIEMIRENDEIKLPRRKVKTPKIVRKIFGMEGEIALKNMKRNKRKYRITLLSLFVSIVLFISFSTYLKVGITLTDFTDVYQFDISVMSPNKKDVEAIRNMEYVDKSYLYQEQLLMMKLVDKSLYNKDFYKYFEERYDEEMLQSYSIAEIVLNDKDFEELARSVRVSNSIPIFLNQVNFVRYENSNRTSYQTKLFEKNASSISICGLSEREMKDPICKDYSVTFLNEIPEFAKYLAFNTSNPALFVSESMIKEDEILKLQTDYTYLTILSKEYQKLYDNIENKYKNSNNVFYSSPRIELEQQKNSILAIKILLYGFITLVTLTGITSVFNTIYTSIHLRRKEFAMLRSVGLSPKGFNRMIFFESFFFGLKSLFFAIPVSFFFIYLINNSIGGVYLFDYLIIPWDAISISVCGVFLIVLLTMWYSVSKIKKENILSSLRDENI